LLSVLPAVLIQKTQDARVDPFLSLGPQ
jgi:hypothetical protein